MIAAGLALFAALASGSGKADARALADQRVREVLGQDRYRFCHDPRYPLYQDEKTWCPAAGELNARCPSLPPACQGRALSDWGANNKEPKIHSGTGTGSGSDSQPRERPEAEEESSWNLPALDGLGRIILYLLAAAGLAALIYALVYGLMHRNADPEAEESPSPGGEDPASAAAARGPIETDVERLLARARACAERGEFERALDFLYAALLRRLDGDGLIRIRPWRTNGDYLRDLRARPDLHADVRAIVREIERVQFGSQAASGDLFASLMGRVAPLVGRALAAVALLLMMGGLGACGLSGRGGSADDAPSGMHAVTELLTKYGFEPRARLAPVSAIADEDGTLALLPGSHLDAKSWDKALAWVKKGHTLVVASGTHYLPLALGLDEHDDGAPDVDARVTSDELAEIGDLKVRVPGGRWLELRGAEATPISRRGDKTYAASVALGDGEVIVFADGRLFENASLTVADNAAFLAKVLGGGESGPRKLAFADESTGAAASSPAQSVSHSKLAPFTLQLALLVGLFLLYKGVAFGALRDPPASRRRAFVEHVRALGAQYAKARATRHAVGLYSAWALDRMREVGGKGSLSQLADAIARRTGRTLGETMRIILEARAARDEQRPSSSEDLPLMRELSQLMHELGGTREHRRG